MSVLRRASEEQAGVSPPDSGLKVQVASESISWRTVPSWELKEIEAIPPRTEKMVRGLVVPMPTLPPCKIVTRSVVLSEIPNLLLGVSASLRELKTHCAVAPAFFPKVIVDT